MKSVSSYFVPSVPVRGPTAQAIRVTILAKRTPLRKASAINAVQASSLIQLGCSRLRAIGFAPATDIPLPAEFTKRTQEIEQNQ
jgi:hypothetical protein